MSVVGVDIREQRLRTVGDIELRNVLETGFALAPRSGDLEIGWVIHLTGPIPVQVQVSACEAM